MSVCRMESWARLPEMGPGLGRGRRKKRDRLATETDGAARRGAELSSSQRGRLAGPCFVFEILVGGFAAVGDESPTYRSNPDTKTVGLGSCFPTLA
jgi:hypothetical protein